MGKASNAIRIEKIFNHQKKLICNFLEKWLFQFAVFQDRLAIRELGRLISRPAPKNKCLRNISTLQDCTFNKINVTDVHSLQIFTGCF